MFISNDEAIYHQSALNVIAAHTPHTLGNYGPLGSYIQIPFIIISFITMFLDGTIKSPLQFELLLTTQEGYLLFIPRAISALFGALSIIVIFKLSIELFKDKISAIWASTLFAASFNLVHIAHQARSWSPAIFFSLLAILFALKSVKNDRARYVLLAYVFGAIAFGFHQLSGIIILLVFTIRICSRSSVKKLRISKNDFVAIILCAACIFAFTMLSTGKNLFWILDPKNPNVGLIKMPKNYENAFDLFYKVLQGNNVTKVISDLLQTDGVIFCAALIGFLKSRRGKYATVIILFVVFNFLLSTFIFPPFLRYMLVSIAVLPIFAGYAFSKLGRSRVSFLIAFFLFFITSLNSINWNLLISNEPTFDQVRKWVDKNIDRKVPVIITSRRNFSWVPMESSSRYIRIDDPGYYLRVSRLVDDRIAPNVRNILDSSRLSVSKTEGVNKALKIYPAQYIVDWYFGKYDRLLYQPINHRLQLVAHFTPTPGYVSDEKLPEALFDAAYNLPLFKVDRPGPYFDVLKVEW